MIERVASPFRSSVIHFLAKLSKICELVTQDVNTSSHIKGNPMALTAVVSSS